jgi:A/G-specific adenine glycosylase
MKMKENQTMPDAVVYEKIVEPLLSWYDKNARQLPWRQDREPYHVWLSEIMLQQTRVEAVKGYYTRFLDALPTIEALAAVPDDTLMKLWEGLGYYNRARNLKKAAQVIVNEYNGIFPTTYEEVLALPGIGAYTAGAICSICYGQGTPAVDGNVLRVMSRISLDYEAIEKPAMKKRVTKYLELVYPKQGIQSGKFTQSLMELGAMVCIPGGTPKCEICPVKHVCHACQDESWKELPVRLPKAKRKVEEKTVFYLTCKNQVAVGKRQEQGLLAGMWELPNVEGRLSLEEALRQVAKWQCQPKNILQKRKKKHIFTHIEWHMECYYIECSVPSPQFTWISMEEMTKNIPLPTAFKQFL